MIATLARITGVSPLVIEAVVLGLLLLAFAGVGLKIYDAGYSSADSAWQAKNLQSQVDAMEKDRDDARAAAADAKLRLAALEQEAQADKERTAHYAEEIVKRPTPGCALTDDDLRGMRVEPTPKPRAPRKGSPGIAGWLDGARARAAHQAR